MMEIALYKNIEHGYIVAGEVETYENNNGHIITSLIVDVDFTMLDKSDTAQQEIAIIDDQIKVVMAESENKLTELKRRKSELLAIGCDEQLIADEAKDHKAKEERDALTEERLTADMMACDKADQEHNARMEKVWDL